MKVLFPHCWCLVWIVDTPWPMKENFPKFCQSALTVWEGDKCCSCTQTYSNGDESKAGDFEPSVRKLRLSVNMHFAHVLTSVVDFRLLWFQLLTSDCWQFKHHLLTRAHSVFLILQHNKFFLLFFHRNLKRTLSWRPVTVQNAHCLKKRHTFLFCLYPYASIPRITANTVTYLLLLAWQTSQYTVICKQ